MICTRYGPPEVLQLREAEKPVPGENEVLVRIRAAAVTVSDCIVRGGKVNPLLWLPMRMFVGFRRPRNPVLGMELAGEIEAAGRNIHRFQPGDRVFAFTGMRFGAFAEYVCLPENGTRMPADSLIACMPSGCSFGEAAALPSRATLALYFLREGNIRRGQKVLIYGASGGAGTFAVQLAKHFGAEVTGVCGAANIAMVKSLGAEKVIDYTEEDFTESGKTWDFIFDAVGKRYSSKLDVKKALTPNGIFLSVDDKPGITLEYLEEIRDLTEAGKIKTVIGRNYPLEQLAEAQRYIETGHKTGNVVIDIGNNATSACR
jgi:NADPH:quinone reductase-like Zn-dependent oxidoreductase